MTSDPPETKSALHLSQTSGGELRTGASHFWSGVQSGHLPGCLYFGASLSVPKRADDNAPGEDYGAIHLGMGKIPGINL
jgi:hypothetical protein